MSFKIDHTELAAQYKELEFLVKDGDKSVVCIEELCIKYDLFIKLIMKNIVDKATHRR